MIVVDENNRLPLVLAGCVQITAIIAIGMVGIVEVPSILPLGIAPQNPATHPLNLVRKLVDGLLIGLGGVIGLVRPLPLTVYIVRVPRGTHER